MINIALSYMQFETRHVYNDDNDRLGRALIRIQMALYDNNCSILCMSGIFELYKPLYQRFLMKCRRGNLSQKFYYLL